MKISQKLLATIILILFATCLKAQKDSIKHRAKTIYIEALRLREFGTVFTANFDMRLNKSQKGIGVHGGIGVEISVIDLKLAGTFFSTDINTVI